MKQLYAKHPMTGMVMIKRFLNGSQYLKVTPKHMIPLVYEGLQKQFHGKEIELMTVGEWIRITRHGNMERLKEAAENAVKGSEAKFEEDPEEYALKTEGDLLKKQGFIVEIQEVPED